MSVQDRIASVATLAGPFGSSFRRSLRIRVMSASRSSRVRSRTAGSMSGMTLSR